MLVALEVSLFWFSHVEPEGLEIHRAPEALFIILKEMWYFDQFILIKKKLIPEIFDLWIYE